MCSLGSLLKNKNGYGLYQIFMVSAVVFMIAIYPTFRLGKDLVNPPKDRFYRGVLVEIKPDDRKPEELCNFVFVTEQKDSIKLDKPDTIEIYLKMSLEERRNLVNEIMTQQDYGGEDPLIEFTVHRKWYNDYWEIVGAIIIQKTRT